MSVLIAAGPTPIKPKPVLLYAVSSFQPVYLHEHSGLPTAIEMNRWKIQLSQKQGIYQPPDPSAAVQDLTLGQNFPPNTIFSPAAINSIDDQIVLHFKQLGIQAIFVVPDELDSRTGRDNRRAGRTALTLRIVVGTVTKLQTITEGADVSVVDRVSDQKYNFVRKYSPITIEDGKNFIDQSSVNDYLALLNRRGVRHVDAALSSADATTIDELSLDYIIREDKPWTVYAGLSNTGTEETSPLRTRFGVIGNNIGTMDASLTADVVTTFSDKSNAVNLDYSAPLGLGDRLRWNIHGDFSNFTASDIAVNNVNLSGNNSGVQAELVDTLVSQANSPSDLFFVDIFGGARAEYMQINNKGPDGGGFDEQQGTALNVVPYVGARFEHVAPAYPTFLELKATGILAIGEDDLANYGNPAATSSLGRRGICSNAFLVSGQLNQSYFLDSLFSPTKSESGNNLLAYELFGSVSGQYAFNSRLNPVHEGVVGGLYSVRGYRQSIVSGDTSVVATGEFRLHVPRLLGVVPEEHPISVLGKPFYPAPPRRGTTPDWDFIVRPFIDIGYVANNGSDSVLSTVHENRSNALIGAGVGAELDVWQNLSFRVDYGIALKSVTVQQDIQPKLEASSGTSQVSFSLLLTY